MRPAIYQKCNDDNLFRPTSWTRHCNNIISKIENLHICDVISKGEVTSSKTGCLKDRIHYYGSSTVGHRHLESLGGN